MKSKYWKSSTISSAATTLPHSLTLTLPLWRGLPRPVHLIGNAKLLFFGNPWQPIWSAKFIRAQISNDELIICNLIVSGWTRTMMEVWRKRSSWRVASKMTSCRRCWPPTWPRRWGALTKSDWVGRRPWTWCIFANDLRRCIYMYFSAFNPKQAGADVDDC